MGWLLFRDHQGAEKVVNIPPGQEVVCGRSRHADLILPGGTISRRHAIFFHHEGCDWVADAGSKNGCTLNGAALEASHRLRDGDTIGLGAFSLSYHIGTPAPQAIAPASAGPEVGRRRGRPPPENDDPSVLIDTSRWRGVSLVGRGGMGDVYAAYDHDLGTSVALKRLRRRRGGDLSLLKQLHEREAAIGRTLSHPNVVQVLEDGLYRGQPYLLMEWVEGETLRDHLERNSELPLGEGIEIIRQIALGLDAAHSGGVVHADLKPANLLVLPASPQEDLPESHLDILESPAEVPRGRVGDETLEDALGQEIARRSGVPDLPELAEPPFIGRDAELALLDELLGEVMQGQRRWVVILGDRGAGKRRLVEEFRRRQTDVAAVRHIRVLDDLTPPSEDGSELWISLVPAQIPDDPRFRRAYERGRVVGTVCELYLKPLLRGQAIRMVEGLVRHPPSAREFVSAVERETAGNPQGILEALRRAFSMGAWKRSGGGYRFLGEVYAPDERVAARTVLTRLEREEKGLRDLLKAVSPLGSCLDFETMLAVTGIGSASLYYLLEFAVGQGYLKKDSLKGQVRYQLASEPVRRVLEARLGEHDRRRLVQKALPHLAAFLQKPGTPASCFQDAAAIYEGCGEPARAFRLHLEGALGARSAYDSAGFLRCIDAARECYRRVQDQSRSKRELGRHLEELLGEAGRGLGGIDRLRQLPRRVRVKVSDFGISRHVGNEDEDPDDPQEPWGTPRYMSPEQVRRRPLTPASDIFSLGILAREILDGRHPLGDLQGKAALSAILEGSLTAPTLGRPGYPPPLCGLIGRMLEGDPEVRPGASEVAKELQSLQLQLLLGEARR